MTIEIIRENLFAKRFLFEVRSDEIGTMQPAISLFSGGGISDLGFERSGFRFLIQAEKEKIRSELCQRNFPSSKVLNVDLTKKADRDEVVKAYRKKSGERLSLLSITPPCQGMSSSNPGRGKIKDADDVTRDKRNKLLLYTKSIIKDLSPRFIVIENVPFALNKEVRLRRNSQPRKLIELFVEMNPEFEFFEHLTQMADYGIPQLRKRAIIVGIHKEEKCLPKLSKEKKFPWPEKTHAEDSQNGNKPWVTVKEWLSEFDYPKLDAISEEAAKDNNDSLHTVPHYSKTRYSWVADIPPHSGRSAYQNDTCPECGKFEIPEDLIICPNCGANMINRPHVEEGERIRLIKGFKSSYRRTPSDLPARTITTSSSHLGSDYKIHPWENRVFSARECADLQTIPRFYDWSPAIDASKTYAIRQVIGEALPPYYAFLLGKVFRDLMD